MSDQKQFLEIGSSPHVTSGASVDVIMRNVFIALLPVCVFAIYAFGIAAALVLITATLTCVVTEHVICRLNRQPSTVGDWSVAITGLLYGLTLPPDLPLWMVAVGAHLCGCCRQGAFRRPRLQRVQPGARWPCVSAGCVSAGNDALVLPFAADRFSELPGSILAFPFAEPVYDAVTAATPLARMKFEAIQAENPELLWGLTSGSVGETCSALIVLGGVYLVARNMMNWRIPISILLTVSLITWIFMQIDPAVYPQPTFMLFSGGLMLGAVFMATDMVASPITNAGCWVYGILIGGLVVVIRFWGGMPEGVMYAILLANAVSPHIDYLIQPRVFGTGRGAG